MGQLRRGFAQEAESIAEQVRADLGIGNIVRLDPLALGRELEIPVLTLAELLELAPGLPGLADAVGVLRGPEQRALSALTVFFGARRLIVFNERHAPARQASDLAHELAHGLLIHPPTPAFDAKGCRTWSTTVEDEATYLAGALLVPGKAARWVAKAGMTVEDAARRFGCSTDMINWRMNKSGARRLQRGATA